jgi:Flp pilus assembly pilin Flp
MDKITATFVKLSEPRRGQAITEYALILATVAIVVFVGYQLVASRW